MDNQLRLIADSYDQGIDLGRNGIDPYSHLPESITGDPDYAFYKECEIDDIPSCHKEIREYLSPAANMNFIDLGCCLNLMFRGYDEWPSTYYGVDISRKTVELLEEFTSGKSLSIGSFYCGSIHETPFESGFFDIGTCIGVLEYYERTFVEKAIMEIHRILKPGGKFVLDTLNLGNPACRIAMRIEEYLGRPDKFDLPIPEFEDLLQNCFEIEKADKTGAMIQYFLRCRK